DLGALDFAGGTAIHVNAGVAALAAVLVLGRRRGWPGQASPPHSMPLVMLGAGILWFGWFGFNAGSALAANGQAIQAFLNTFVAAAAAGLVWGLVEKARTGHVTNLGVASGIVAGLVAITPSAGFVARMAPVVIGALAAVAWWAPARCALSRARPSTAENSISDCPSVAGPICWRLSSSATWGPSRIPSWSRS